MDKLLAKAQRLCDHIGASFRAYEGYSGRGMCGRTAARAFVTDQNPNTSAGCKLRAMGFANVDMLGREVIYYSDALAPSPKPKPVTPAPICEDCEGAGVLVRVAATKLDGTLLDSADVCAACAKARGFTVGKL